MMSRSIDAVPSGGRLSMNASVFSTVSAGKAIRLPTAQDAECRREYPGRHAKQKEWFAEAAHQAQTSASERGKRKGRS
jgi:hypothetical protein